MATITKSDAVVGDLHVAHGSDEYDLTDDKPSFVTYLRHLISQALDSDHLVVEDADAVEPEADAEVVPDEVAPDAAPVGADPDATTVAPAEVVTPFKPIVASTSTDEVTE